MGFLKCIIYIAALGVGSFWAGRLIPPSWLHEDSFPYKCCRWEKSGTIYNAVKIRKWQRKVPDMSKIFPQFMPPKKIGKNFRDELPLLIKETCIAELIHVLLCFAGLYCMRLWTGIGGILVTVVYIVFGNIPFILIQRYNRPRLVRLYKKVTCTQQ